MNHFNISDLEDLLLGSFFSLAPCLRCSTSRVWLQHEFGHKHRFVRFYHLVSHTWVLPMWGRLPHGMYLGPRWKKHKNSPRRSSMDIYIMYRLEVRRKKRTWYNTQYSMSKDGYLYNAWTSSFGERKRTWYNTLSSKFRDGYLYNALT